jgi:glycosyltransferase involved in cell wall biosynthesis
MVQCYGSFSVRAGRIAGRISRIRPPGIMFFFPCYNFGGSTRVHVDIVTAVSDQNPWVILTSFASPNERFLRDFTRAARVFDFTRTPFRRWIIGFVMGFFAGVASNRRGTRVFGCNSLPFYRALPWFDASSRRMDLLHYIIPDEPHESLPYARYLDQRIIINAQTREHLLRQYRQHGIPLSTLDRVRLIENGVLIPECPARRGRKDSLTVIYVGRGSAEKRIYIIGRIARECAQRGVPVTFQLAGSGVQEFVSQEDRPYCQWVGCITDDARLVALYRQADVLMMTSRLEGFPMVIMEAMAEGVVPLTTEALGGIGRHIRDNSNGFLVTAEDESDIVRVMVDRLIALTSRPDMLERLSAAARAYATEHFDIAVFRAQYRQLLVESAPAV